MTPSAAVDPLPPKDTMPGFEPAYTKAYHGSRLRRNIEAAGAQMSDCTLCPRMCRVDRLSGEQNKREQSNQTLHGLSLPHAG